MKIAITGSTGNIGKALTGHLLDAEADVALLVRSPEKVAAFAERGAEVRPGAMEDADYLKGALAGCDALFWLTPPNYVAEDFRAFQNDLGAKAVAAVEAAGVGHVLNLSSVGAHRESGNGPVNGLHDVEQAFANSPAHVLHLRPAYFFENYLHSVDGIKAAGAVFLPVPGDLCVPMIATADIARVAADLLQNPSWEGKSARELHGPADLTFDEAAAAIAEVSGKACRHVQVEEAQAREALQGMGASPNVVETMLELYRGLQTGNLAAEQQRSSNTTTPTPLADWARAVLASMLA